MRCVGFFWVLGWGFEAAPARFVVFRFIIYLRWQQQFVGLPLMLFLLFFSPPSCPTEASKVWSIFMCGQTIKRNAKFAVKCSTVCQQTEAQQQLQQLQLQLQQQKQQQQQGIETWQWHLVWEGVWVGYSATKANKRPNSCDRSFVANVSWSCRLYPVLEWAERVT